MTREEMELLIRIRDESEAAIKRHQANMKAAGGAAQQAGQQFNQAGVQATNFRSRVSQGLQNLTAFAGGLNNVNAGLRQNTQQFQQSGQAAAAAAQQYTHAGQLAQQASGIVAGAFASQAVFRGTVNAAADIESSFIAVAKTASLTDDQMVQLVERTREISRELRAIPFEELQSIQIVGGQAGFEDVETLAAFTETMAKLAATSDDLRGEEGATTFARFLSISDTAAEDIDNIGAAVTSLGNSAVATEGQILTMAQKIAQTTSQFDITTESIVGLAAAGAEFGLGPELFSSSIGRILLNLQAAADGATEGMDTLTQITGLTRQEFRALIQENPTKAFLTFSKAIQATKGQGSTYLNLLQDLNLYGEDNRRVIGTAAAEYDTFAQYIVQATQASRDNIATNAEFAKQQEAFNAGLTDLSNSFLDLREAVGKSTFVALGLVFRGVSVSMQVAADTFRSLPEPIQTVIGLLITIGPAILTGVAAVNLLRLAFMTLGITTFIQGVIALGTSAVGAAASIGLLTVAVKALAMAFVAIGAGMALDAGVTALADNLRKSFPDATAAVRDFNSQIGPLQTIIDLLATDITTGTIMSGVNAGKQMWGERVQEEVLGISDRVREAQREVQKLGDDFGLLPDIATSVPEFGLNDELETALQKLDTYRDKLADIFVQQKAIDMMQEGLDAGQSGAPTQEEIDRYQNLLDVQKRLADPLAVKTRSLEDEIDAARAVTGAAKEQLTIQQAIRDVIESRGSITAEETRALTEQVQYLQEIQRLNFMTNRMREVEQELAMAGARTATARAELSIQQEIKTILREQGAIAADMLVELDAGLRQLSTLNLFNALEDRLDPAGAALRQYTDDVRILDQALAAGLIPSTERYEQLLAQLATSTLAARSPLLERVRMMNEEVRVASLQGREREIEQSALQELNNLRSQGVVITDELTAAVYEYSRAMSDANFAGTNGIQGWINAVGTFEEQLAEVQSSTADSVSSLIVGLLSGTKDSLKTFFADIGQTWLKAGIDGIMARMMESMMPENPEVAALNRAKAAIEKIEAMGNAALNTPAVTVTAGTVSVNGAPLTAANTNTPFFTGLPASTVTVKDLPPLASNDNGIADTAERVNAMFDQMAMTGTDAVGATAALLKKFEGFSTSAYWDVNAYRAGYGSDTTTMADGTVRAVTQNTVVTLADSDRDLFRRIGEFASVVNNQTGGAVMRLDPAAQAALNSVAYNYGSLPQSVADAVRSGNTELIAQAVENLKPHNDGINADRRQLEADIIRQSGQAAQQAGTQFQTAAQQIAAAGQQVAQAGTAASGAITPINSLGVNVAQAGTTAGAATPQFADLGGVFQNVFSSLFSAIGGKGGGGGNIFGSLFSSIFSSIFKFAGGGQVNGKGTGTSDSNLAWLSDKEFVVNAKATKDWLPLLAAINDNRIQPRDLPAFATGGYNSSSLSVGERALVGAGSRGGGDSYRGGDFIVGDINVPIQGSSGDPAMDEQAAQKTAKAIDVMLDKKMADWARNQSRNGGMLNKRR